MSFISILPNKR